jgi:hypothetical protein
MEEAAKQAQAAAAAAAAVAAQQHPAAAVSAVSVKLPPFWVDNAEVWFLQAEAQFAIAGISSERTAFYHVLTALPHHVGVTTVAMLNKRGSVGD